MLELAKYVRNCVVSEKIYTADKNFTRPPVAAVATNFKSVVGIYFGNILEMFWKCFARCEEGGRGGGGGNILHLQERGEVQGALRTDILCPAPRRQQPPSHSRQIDVSNELINYLLYYNIIL